MNAPQTMALLKIAWNRLAREAPPPATEERRGLITIDQIGTGSADTLTFVRKTAADTYEWATVVANDEATALTAADASTVDTTYGAEEAAVIANLRTRLGEVEAKLQSLGVLA